MVFCGDFGDFNEESAVIQLLSSESLLSEEDLEKPWPVLIACNLYN